MSASLAQVLRSWRRRRSHYVAASTAGLVLVVALSGQEAQPPQNPDHQLFIGNPDGSEMKPLVDVPDYTMHGSPTWSQDGKLIAFDAWRPKLGEKNTDSKIIVVNADGTNPRILGDGAMPSFSPRHTRIAFSRYEPNYGVWVMSTDGPDNELIQLMEGWSAKWSPDGTHIAYTMQEDQGQNLVLYSLVEGDHRPLFRADKLPYSVIYWNFAWSPDSRRIAFKGQMVNTGKVAEIAIVDVRGADQGLVTRLEGQPSNFNLTWTADSRRIVFSQQTPSRGNRMQLYSMNADTQDPPELLPGQDATRANIAAAFSPDGKQLVIASRKPPANNAAKNKNKKNKAK